MDKEPDFQITIWPNRSLKPEGFVWVMGLTFGMFMIPLLIFVGTPMMWAIALPVFITFFGLWIAFKRNYRDGSVHENIKIWPNLITVERVNPRTENQFWEANPHWVKVKLHHTELVENYLTLTGANREIEIGVFLTPKERFDLYTQLLAELRKYK